MEKTIILEGIMEKSAEDFIRQTIKGTEWEGKVFAAGGYVRDEFMGKDPKDLDLLINSPNGGIEFANWITKKLGIFKGGPDETPGSNPVVFPRFGTAKFNLRGVSHNGVDLSDMDIECVMPRKEQYTAGSRKPVVSGGELKDDVERRDFTVNSLLKDLSSGEILDLTGMGKDDIKAGIVRTPLNPDKIFTDDPLRMLRAVRFATKYNWKLPMFMLRGLKKNAGQLNNISRERVRDELDKMLMTNSPAKAIKLLKTVGLLQYVIPELVPAIKMTQNAHHKHDVFTHTLDVLSKTQPVLVQRLMGLFHDIGKTVTRSVTPSGVHFYGHEMASEDIADEVMRRLKYPVELIDAVKLGVRNHMRLKSAGDTGVNLSDKALRKFRADIGEQLENMLDVMHADNVAHSEASSMPNQISNIRKRLETLSTNVNAGTGKPKLPITGNDLKELGLQPGPVFSKIMSAVTDAWFENPNISKEEALNIAKTVAST
jgi:poly(A) polymerase